MGCKDVNKATSRGTAPAATIVCLLCGQPNAMVAKAQAAWSCTAGLSSLSQQQGEAQRLLQQWQFHPLESCRQDCTKPMLLLLALQANLTSRGYNRKHGTVSNSFLNSNEAAKQLASLAFQSDCQPGTSISVGGNIHAHMSKAMSWSGCLEHVDPSKIELLMAFPVKYLHPDDCSRVTSLKASIPTNRNIKEHIAARARSHLLHSN